MPRTVLSACLVAVLAALAAPVAQAQDTRDRILRECQDGALRGDYSIQDIRDARNNIPDDIEQYSDCRDVLSRALTNVAGGGGGTPTGTGSSGGGTSPTGGAGGGGFGSGAGGGLGAGASGGGGGGGAGLTPSTDEDRRALEDAAAGGTDPVAVGAREVVPGAAGLATGAARNALPVTLLIALGLLVLTALAAMLPLARRQALRPLIALGPAIRRRVRRRRPA